MKQDSMKTSKFYRNVRCFLWLLLLLPLSAFSEDNPLKILILGPRFNDWYSRSRSRGCDPEILSGYLRSLYGSGKSDPKATIGWINTGIGDGLSLMNFYYHPKARKERHKAITDSWTHVILLGAPFACQAPELHFEGVRVVAEHVKKSGAKPMLVMSGIGEDVPQKVALHGELAYRVGRGCGLDVIPLGYLWSDVLKKQNKKMRLNREFMAAVSIYSQISKINPVSLVAKDKRHPERLFMAKSVEDSLKNIKDGPVFTKPFQGRVRAVTRQTVDLIRIIRVGTISEKIWSKQMMDLLKNVGIKGESTNTPRSPAGFQPAAYENIHSLLEKKPHSIVFSRRYNITDTMMKGLREASTTKELQFQVYDRHWDMHHLSKNDRLNAINYVPQLEQALFQKYAEAKRQKLHLIPFHVALARMNVVRPDAPLTRDGVHWTPWYAYMLANMSYTAFTGKSGEMTLRFWQSTYDPKEADYMFTAAQIGHKVMMQLSSLSIANDQKK